MKITDIQVDGYERVARCEDPESGLIAFIGVHDTTLGPALGGLRMWKYAGGEDEALTDVLRLSRGMTFKSAVARTGLGGGKSVIYADSRTDKSKALFEAFGRFVDSFGGAYITAEDVGTTVDDLLVVRNTTKYVTGLPREMGSSGDPSPYTALGTFEGIRVSVAEKLGSPDLTGRVVAIQGPGHVGYPLARSLHEAGAKLVVCDIDGGNVERCVREFGAELVDVDAIYDVECDVYAPCALGATLNDDTIPRLRCQVVAGCANNQLADEVRHDNMLADRGILYAPDYVINAGGIINVSIEVEPQGYDERRALEKISNIPRALKDVYARAKAEGITTAEAAQKVAESILAEGRAAAAAS